MSKKLHAKKKKKKKTRGTGASLQILKLLSEIT